MTEEERFFAAAYLRHRAQEGESTYTSILTERMQRMDGGQKVSLEQVQRIHQALEAEGL
jgi:hypothetical protein